VASQNKLENIPARIRHARLLAGYSPQQMREALRQYDLQYSQGGYHRIENTEPTNPNLRLVETIGKITGVSPGWILFGQGEAMMSDASVAIRRRVIDTIELMASTLNLKADEAKNLEKLLISLRDNT